jgi:hypothetical protein
MGLGIQVSAHLRRSRFAFLRSVIRPDAVADALVDCARGTPLEGMASKLPAESDSRLLVRLHPCAEPVYIDFNGELLTLSAKTSNVGPGYHAFLVDCLDSLQKALGLVWIWDEENSDETDYFGQRDFGDLQRTMAEQVRFLFAVIDNQYGDDFEHGLQISLPMDFSPRLAPGVASTPVGPMDRSKIAEIGKFDQTRAAAFCASYLPWWNKGFDGSFFTGLALNAIWIEHRWAKPVDDIERTSIARTRSWIAKARERGAANSLLDSADRELGNLVNSKSAPVFPAAEGPGYRRLMMTFKLTGNWELQAPGSLIEDSEDDHSTVALWNEAVTIRGSSLLGKLKAPEKTEVREPEREVSFEAAKDGDGHSHTTVVKMTSSNGDHQRCIVTIWMGDPEYRALAEEISATIRFIEPNKPVTYTNLRWS